MEPIVSTEALVERAKQAVEQGVPLDVAQRYPADTQAAQLFEREYQAALKPAQQRTA